MGVRVSVITPVYNMEETIEASARSVKKYATFDDALSRMELVGHDFYLFSDAESGEPSVVYRRRGYDYGVIRLGR